VCACVCVCVCVCLCVGVCVCVFMHVCVHACLCVCMKIPVDLSTSKSKATHTQHCSTRGACMPAATTQSPWSGRGGRLQGLGLASGAGIRGLDGLGALTYNCRLGVKGWG